MTNLKLNPNIAAAPIYTGGAAIEDIQRQYGVETVIKLGSNESPYGPSPKAIAAMQQALAGLNRYPPMGDESLREALAQSLGGGVTLKNFVTGNGGCDVLNMVATAFLSDAGSEAIICRPTFPVYEISARRLGANIIYVDLDPNDFRYDVEGILGAITPKTRVVYVCSPNNPTGSILPAEQMETLVNHLPDDVLLVTDEVYHHFVTAEDYPRSLDYVRQGKNLLILHSFSKAFGLAGLRLGYGIAPEEVAIYLNRARLPFHLDKLTIEAGLAGLGDTAHIERTVAVVREGRQQLTTALADLEMQVWPSQANFVLFKPPFPAADVSERLLRRGVIVRPMSQFYLPEHLRVSVGLPAENSRFIEALKGALAELEAAGIPKNTPDSDSGGGSEFKF